MFFLDLVGNIVGEAVVGDNVLIVVELQLGWP